MLDFGAIVTFLMFCRRVATKFPSQDIKTVEEMCVAIKDPKTNSDRGDEGWNEKPITLSQCLVSKWRALGWIEMNLCESNLVWWDIFLVRFFGNEFAYPPKVSNKLWMDYNKNQQKVLFSRWLGGGFKYFLFSPLFGEDFQFD